MSTIHTPKHYKFRTPAYEMADLTIDMPHALASAMEYIYRAGKKTECPVEDLQKAIWWLNRQIEKVEAEKQ